MNYSGFDSKALKARLSANEEDFRLGSIKDDTTRSAAERENARFELVRKYDRYAESLTKKFCRMRQERIRMSYLSPEDLLQAARVALLESVDQWDYRRNVLLTTFAYMPIIQAMDRELQKSVGPLVCPRRKAKTWIKLYTRNIRFYNENGRWASESELADLLGLSLKEIRSVMACQYRAESERIDSEEKENDGVPAVYFRLENQPARITKDLELADEMNWLVSKAESILPDTIWRCLCLKHGLTYHGVQYGVHSVKEVSKICGKNESSVKVLLRNGKETLRKNFLR